jgi:hypothetical protein
MARGHQGRRPNPQQQSAGGPLQQAQAMAANLNPNALVQQFGVANARALIEAIENERGTRVLCLVYNESIGAQLGPSLFQPLEKTLRRLGRVNALDLFLISTGGMAEVPWRIVSLLREFTERLGIIVPRMALSGATHIAIAADDLVMMPFSSLGSVDPKRAHPLLPKDADNKPIPTSVQDLKHCIEFIREQLGQNSTSQDLALIISELFKHVNPLAIGALEQSYHLSRLITRKVLKTHTEVLTDDHINSIVEKLAGQYFSHSFLISRADVESDLGLTVTKPDQALSDAITALENHYVNSFGTQAQANPPNPFPILTPLFFLQTTRSCSVDAQAISAEGQTVGELMLDHEERQP